MAATVWSNAAKRMVFEILPDIEVNGKKVGYFSQDWSGGQPRPSQFTRQEAEEGIYPKLLAALIKRKAFPNKEPKSSAAVALLVQHAVYPANHPGYRKLRHSLRFAAYHAGFMEMRDIVRLEEAATEKHGERPSK